jgi:hypothetical protein
MLDVLDQYDIPVDILTAVESSQESPWGLELRRRARVEQAKKAKKPDASKKPDEPKDST